MKINFTTSGAAFCDEYESEFYNRQLMIREISRILNKIIDDIHDDKDHGSIMDINGNKIGQWEV